MAPPAPPPPLTGAPPPPPAAAAEPVPAAAVAGIGRRFLALIVDAVVLNLLAAAFFGAQALHAGGAIGVAVFAAAWLYNAGLESSPAQATLGKLLLGLRVTDADAQRISFARASLRFVVKILSGLVLALGYVVAFFTPRRQALHDLAAGTLVLRRTRGPAAPGPPLT